MDPTPGDAHHGVSIDTLPFMREEDRKLATAAPVEAGEEAWPSRMELIRRLRQAANDTFTDLLVVGWHPEAVLLIAKDPVLAGKRITWVLRSRQLALIAAAPPAGLTWRLAICDDPAGLPHILEFLPPCWSLAVLDPDLCPLSELHILGKTRFQRGMLGIPRLVADLRHLWHRLEYLGEAIPLAAWKGMYAGRSALCLAAGPSLDSHLDFIRAHMDRAVVIVVDVIHHKLDQAGIKIDFALNVDSDQRLADRIHAPNDPYTTLVMPYNGHRAMDRRFPQRSYFGHGPFARWLLGADNDFSTGTTVGIASVGFAQFLGCSEAVLIGHDLSFPKKAYYSEFVADRAEHQAAMQAESNLMRRLVPCNDGDKVETDYLFEVGIQDMGMMLRMLTDLTVYNLNINSRTGARILNTQALPEGWTPAGEGETPRPASDRRHADDIHPDLRGLVREYIDAQMANYESLWNQGLDRGLDPLVLDEQTRSNPVCAVGGQHLGPLIAGIILHHMRLLSLPPSIDTRHHRREAADLLRRTLASGRTFISSVLAEAGEAPTGHEDWPSPADYTTDQRRFLTTVMASVREGEDSPAEAILLGPCYRFLRGMMQALGSDHPLPTPQSAHQGLVGVRLLGERTPSRHILLTLCQCALEGVDEPLRWARETGVIAESLLPDAARHPKSSDPQVELDAVCALLRLRATDPTSRLDTDAQIACRWPPCRMHAVRALLQHDRAGIRVLEKLLKRHDLDPDDQTIALILLLSQDFPRACHLVAPFKAHYGEATLLALAKGAADRQDHAQAERFIADVRLLSRFYDQAQAIRCERLFAADDRAGLAATLATVSDGEILNHWQLRLDQQAGDLSGSLQLVAQSPVCPAPAVLAAIAQDAWTRKDRAALVEIFRTLQLKPRPGQDAEERDQFAALHHSLQVMLRSLGADLPGILAGFKEPATPGIAPASDG